MLPKTLTAAIIRPIVLSALARREAYGYELSRRIEAISQGKIEWDTGTLYPVLHRLETDRLVESFWQPSDSGPRRKYYRLTEKGKKSISAAQSQWLEIHEVMLRFWQHNISFG